MLVPSQLGVPSQPQEDGEQLQDVWPPCAPRDSDQDRRDHQAGARLTGIDRELPAHICVCTDMSAQTHHSVIKVLGKTPGSFGQQQKTGERRSPWNHRGGVSLVGYAESKL